VPVVAIFTKFDKLHAVAFRELTGEGKSFREVRALAPGKAKEIFEKNDYSGMLQGMNYPPRKWICLGGGVTHSI
jgi:hypothetical protein